MRLMCIALAVALFLILDQVRFNGYYRLRIVDGMPAAISRVLP